MSFVVLTKKIQDLPVTVFLDQSWVLWLCADDVLQLLRLPASVLQSIPSRHKKCWNDFRCGSTGVNSCRLDGNRVFIDVYGLGNLCNRVNSAQSDYLCTLFIAETYKDACAQSSQSGNGCFPPAPLPDFRPLPDRDCVPDCNRPPNHTELLERILRQNDLIVNGLSQLCINNSNQHSEITNTLNSIKLQNVTITGQLTQIIDLIETQLSAISGDVKTILGEFDARLDTLLNAVNKALTQLQENVRNELTNINSILNNLTSSVTNINATLNNLLQILNNLDLGDLTNINDTLTELKTVVDEILNILTPEIPLTNQHYKRSNVN
ncbi:polyhedral envelope protein [Orgyia leucostigma nucleopolyhedrovirus]|uniref:Polyhedral envelope protein n=1 Tax=Orgyia leucostigma nucleopolyhedrovirus TaxID=490711 RepID=B0FDX7_9ABAC|nr:polyhedral envelope protein [Orgyia leucostigma nucleopolyhedrovirus]ABY65835.1 polyhedral envelope protein [Orgyia leucostigma nucleopolyhedrovirus]